MCVSQACVVLFLLVDLINASASVVLLTDEGAMWMCRTSFAEPSELIEFLLLSLFIFKFCTGCFTGAKSAVSLDIIPFSGPLKPY